MSDRVRCNYCRRDVEFVDISKYYASGGYGFYICKDCFATLKYDIPPKFFAGWVFNKPFPTTSYERLLSYHARLFMQNISTELELDETIARETLEDNCYRFKHLCREAASDWMPIHTRPVVVLQYNREPILNLENVDGKHRVAAAYEWGYDKIFYYQEPIKEMCSVDIEKLPFSSFEHHKTIPYQTLVFPDGIIVGTRGHDRWALLDPVTLAGKKILDLGCNSAQDGIMACVLNPGTEIFGWDIDGAAIDYGMRVAKAWGVQNRVHLFKADVMQCLDNIPKADILFCFSVAKVIKPEFILRAFEKSEAGYMWLETHSLVPYEHMCGGVIMDDPDSFSIFDDKRFGWVYYGNTSRRIGEVKSRRLFLGRKK